MSELQQTQQAVKERRTLQYIFSDQEIHDLSQQLASKTKESISVKEERSKITAEYGAKLKDIEVSKNKLAEQITNGFEFREVDVEILFHTPSEGQKTTKRLDTGDIIVEIMEQHEFTLFTQYNGGSSPDTIEENGGDAEDGSDQFFGDSDFDQDEEQDGEPAVSKLDLIVNSTKKKGTSRKIK